MFDIDICTNSPKVKKKKEKRHNSKDYKVIVHLSYGIQQEKLKKVQIKLPLFNLCLFQALFIYVSFNKE
jgi:tRNA U54 and U55 pseudouridine synthase Pus10